MVPGSPDDPTAKTPGVDRDADLGAAALFGIGGLFVIGGALGGDDDTARTGIGLVFGSVIMYTALPPLLHVRKGNPRGAVRSALARVGLPLVVGRMSYAASGDADSAAAGMAVGIGVAMVTDWAVFAKMPGTRLYTAPAVDGGVQVGLGGAF